MEEYPRLRKRIAEAQSSILGEVTDIVMDWLNEEVDAYIAMDKIAEAIGIPRDDTDSVSSPREG